MEDQIQLEIELIDARQTNLARLSRWRIQFNPGSAQRGYLITLSALASTFGGIVRPICLAAFQIENQLEHRRLLQEIEQSGFSSSSGKN